MLDQEITNHLEYAVSSDPKNLDIVKLAVKFYLEKNDLLKAESILGNFGCNNKSDLIFFLKSQIALKRKEYKKASEYIATCIGLNPSIEYLSIAYQIELHNGDKNKLFEYLNLLVEKDSKDGWHYYELARLLDAEYDYQRIFYLIETSISLLHYNEKPIILKYEILQENRLDLQGTPFYKTQDNILRELNQIVKLDPKNHMLGYYVAQVNYKNKNFDNSILILEKKSINNEDFLLLGKCFMEKKNYLKAIKFFNKIKLPRNEMFLINKFKGICALHLKKYSDARKYLLCAYDLYDVEQEKNKRLYDFHIKNNEFKKAKNVLISKIKIRNFMSDICMMLHQFRDIPDDKDYLEKALNVNNQNSNALYEMGLFHKKTCTQEALTYFLKCVQYDWTNNKAHHQLSLLYKEHGQIKNYIKHKKISEQLD